MGCMQMNRVLVAADEETEFYKQIMEKIQKIVYSFIAHSVVKT